jgi:methylated-DNA-[protein]-cysteine S-methyltransferase
MRNTLSQQFPCGFTETDLIAEALGESTVASSQRVRTHLTACHACTVLLEQYQRLRTHLSSLPLPEVSEHGLHEARRALNRRLIDPTRPRLSLGVWHSPVGDIRLGKTAKGVALLEFVKPESQEPPLTTLQKAFAIEAGGQEIAELIQKLEDYFSGKRHDLGWIVDDALMRSDFQRQVLQATAEVPYGTVVTYQGIAEAIGQPKALRAVAQALRHNPVPIHIPCHRVIGSDGTLTGYAGNLIAIKKQVLEVEGIPVVETTKGLSIPKQRMYIGWRHDRCFCRPDCSSLQDQSAGDRAFIPSRTRAEAMGYMPCDMCRPDVHPLSLL